MKLGMQIGLGPDHIVLNGDPAPPPQRNTAPNFRPMSVVAKAGWIKMPLGIGLGPGHIVLDGNPAPVPQRGGAQPSIFSHRLLWPNGHPSQLLLSTC